MAESDVDALSNSFVHFCNVSGKKGGIADVKLNNKAWTKMCKDSKVIDKHFTGTDTDIIWSKMCPKGTKEIDFKTFQTKLKDVVAPEYKKKCKLASDEAAHSKLLEKISKAEVALTGVTKQSKTGNVEHFTDTSKYTGAHKERFDESGKGKGKEGRADVADNTGYVGAYKGEGTYDEKTKK